VLLADRWVNQKPAQWLSDRLFAPAMSKSDEDERKRQERLAITFGLLAGDPAAP